MPADLLLGVDLGTTALKAGLFDLDGQLVAVAERPYATDRPLPNWAEQDPQHWLAAVAEALDQLEGAARGRRVAALGVCGQVNTHVFVDEAGSPLRPAVLWQDQRCAAIANEFGLDASSLICRAEWLRRHEPELWERTAFVLSPKDFLLARLCALRSAVTDPTSSIGLVDLAGGYDKAVLARVPGLAERMPRIERIDAPIGAAARPAHPLVDNALIVVGSMDAWGNLYGSGAVEHGDAIEVAGTSEIVGVLSRESYPVPGIVSFPPLDGLQLHAGPTQAGGAAVVWLAELLGSPIEKVLDAAAQAPPGSNGLLFLPYLLGERAPLWDSDTRAAFIGLSSDHGFAHLCRSVLEGVAYSARHLLEEIEKAALVQPEVLNSSGGGSRSDLWCQIKADVLERPVARLRVRQSGCLGAALMAASGAGLVSNLREAATRMVIVEETFEPQDGRVNYDDLYALYRGLYLDLRPTHAALAERRGGSGAIQEVPCAN